MPRVSLHFEDQDGEIAFRVDYKDGLDATSPAHRLANQVIKFLDDNAEKKTFVSIDAKDVPFHL